MGRKSFTSHCILSRNGHGVTTTALTDTGANAFLLIDTLFAKRIAEFTGASYETLDSPVPVKGFDGQYGKPITQLLRCNFSIDKRRQYNTPFLVTDLGNHDLIIGRKWLVALDLWLDVRNRQLIWPSSLPPTPLFVKMIIKTLDELRQEARTDPVSQEDAQRRQEAFEKDVQLDPRRITILRRPSARTQLALSLPLAQETTTPIISKPPVRTPWKPRDLWNHSEAVDRKTNL